MPPPPERERRRAATMRRSVRPSVPYMRRAPWLLASVSTAVLLFGTLPVAGMGGATA